MTGKRAQGIPDARLRPDGRVIEVRADHAERYRWAGDRIASLGKRAPAVVDAGTNCGYGACILAERGCVVVGVDTWAPGIEWGAKRWAHPRVQLAVGDITSPHMWNDAGTVDAVTAFEVIEHLDDPAQMLRYIAAAGIPRLFASVPNEDVLPWSPRWAPGHKRHYTADEFEHLLVSCGYRIEVHCGQRDGYSPVAEWHPRGMRTIVVEAVLDRQA